MLRAQQLKSGDISLGMAHEFVCAFGRQNGTAQMLQRAIEDTDLMSKVVDAMCLDRFSYDAVSMLGFGDPSDESLPDAEEGEIIIRYGGWSLTDLRDCSLVRDLNIMWQQDWYDKYQWSTEKLPAGIYRLRIPIPNSNKQTFEEQRNSLPDGEEPAPVVLVATALLTHFIQTGEDLLKTDFTRCKEQATDGNRVALDWDGGRLIVSSDCWGRRRGNTERSFCVYTPLAHCSCSDDHACLSADRVFARDASFFLFIRMRKPSLLRYSFGRSSGNLQRVKQECKKKEVRAPCVSGTTFATRMTSSSLLITRNTWKN